MEGIIGLFLIIGVGVVGWLIAEMLEKRRSQAKISEMEAKLRFSQSQVLNLQNIQASLQKDISSLKTKIERQMEEKSRMALEYHEKWKRGVRKAGALCLVGGTVLGSVVAGLGVWGASNRGHHNKLMELEVMARVSEMHSEHYQKQTLVLEERIKELSNRLREERESKTVALTKLEILLNNLTGDKWGRGYNVDLKNLINEIDSTASTVSGKTDPVGVVMGVA